MYSKTLVRLSDSCGTFKQRHFQSRLGKQPTRCANTALQVLTERLDFSSLVGSLARAVLILLRRYQGHVFDAE